MLGLQKLLKALHLSPSEESEVDQIVIRKGTMKDFYALGIYAHSNARPGAPTRILAMELEEDGPVVGVLVESLPALHTTLRSEAIPERYDALTLRELARKLNKEVRQISRLIIHPEYRKRGFGSKLLNHALDTATTKYTEVLIPLGQKDGVFYHCFRLRLHMPPQSVPLSTYYLYDNEIAGDEA